MSLRSDVEALLARAVVGLDEARDHLGVSQLLWRTLLRTADYGATEAAVVDAATGAPLSDRRVASLAGASLAVHLPSAAIQQYVSLTEVFLGDLVRLWVTAHPFHLRGQIDVQAVVAAADRAAILEPLIDQYAIAMAYKSPREWFKQLNAVVSLGVPADEQVDAFAELKATRDVMVHNRGFANPTYVRKAGPLARAVDGQPIDLPDDYVSDAWQLCRALVDAVGVAAEARA